MAVVDLEALKVLAAESPSADQLHRAGYCDMVAFSDLHDYGYQGRRWFNPWSKDWLVVFSPRWKADAKRLPRVVVQVYEEQVAFHRAIGAPVFAPGCDFINERFPLLEMFDAAEKGCA